MLVVNWHKANTVNSEFMDEMGEFVTQIVTETTPFHREIESIKRNYLDKQNARDAADGAARPGIEHPGPSWRDRGAFLFPKREQGSAERSIRKLPTQRASDDQERHRIGNAARRRA